MIMITITLLNFQQDNDIMAAVHVEAFRSCGGFDNMGNANQCSKGTSKP